MALARLRTDATAPALSPACAASRDGSVSGPISVAESLDRVASAVGPSPSPLSAEPAFGQMGDGNTTSGDASAGAQPAAGGVITMRGMGDHDAAQRVITMAWRAQLEAWASLKSFKKVGEDAPPPDDPGNPTVNFHGEPRSHATHMCTAP